MAGPASPVESPAFAPPPSPGDAAALRRSDFEFELPPELIAQQPAARREDARLLQVQGDRLVDGRIPDLLACFAPGDVLVLNDTRVIKARLLGHKPSGGRVEALIERVLSEREALAMLRASHAPGAGSRLVFSAGEGAAQFGATVLGREEEFFRLAFDQALELVLEAAGQVPLPPYIRHPPAAQDEARYQTVYARAPGAVAAPTAGLHLTPELLAALQERGVEIASVTLHVGAGTFQPVRSEDLREHRMHRERFEITPRTAELLARARVRGRRVVAVGTTSVRALESSLHAGRVQAGSGETALFIRPGYGFTAVDCLLTNFHLPASTLLMLVCAFAGTARVRRAYAHAIARRYRFFSYGDAMLLEHDAGAAGRGGPTPP